MPCGGIWPLAKVNGKWAGDPELRCWQCNRSGADHFCEEWDTGLHGKCIAEFLETEEGKVVVNHGHQVRRYDEVLHEET